jgi:D-glycero-D-manno-heptose 1,7-bisphosphate phosphatase
MTVGSRPVVLLDRDGVINEAVPRPPDVLCESPLDPRAVRLVDGAPSEMRRLLQAGFDLACVTNQPAPAKGEASVETVDAVQARVLEMLALGGIQLAATRICMHHPEGVPGNPFSRPCGCRKPSPGMLNSVMRALHSDPSRSWMVGDTDSDVAAGTAAGLRTVLIECRGTGHKRSGAAQPTVLVPDLHTAVDAILSACAGRG